MHNMLNQFYKYLSDELIQYLTTTSFKRGDRFYLQFDNTNQVQEFYKVLSESDFAQQFQYKHEQGSLYNTFSIKLSDGMNVVVAATSEKVTPDFLVTLRNQVGEQKGVWANTALLSICHETLDSIRGGSSDLQKEGMPFNVKTILMTLKEKIESSNELKKVDKEVLSFHLSKKLDEAFVHSSLWDYEEVLGFLNEGQIQADEYARLGLFYDATLDQYTPSQMKKRLEENYGLFEKVQHIHEYENLDSQLEKYFSEEGVRALRKESWVKEEYGVVKIWSQGVIGPQLLYLESSKKQTKEHLTYWEKPHKETKAGERKRHIIVFNPKREREVNLTFEFNDRLKKEYIHKKSEKFCSVSGKKLMVALPSEETLTDFYQIVYTHNNESKSKYEFNIAIVDCEPSFLHSIQTIYEVNVRSQALILNKKDEDIIFGNESNEIEEIFVEEENEHIQPKTNTFKVSSSSSAWDDDTLKFSIQTSTINLRIIVKEEGMRITPITGNRVWKLKREHQASFEYNSETNKLKQSTREFSAREDFKNFLIDEIAWIEKDCLYAKREVTGLEKQNLKVQQEVLTAYKNLLSYYKSKKQLPSLSYMDSTLHLLSVEYVRAFINAVAEIPENTILAEEQKNIFKLGSIYEQNKILFTPLHPLNVAYQLQIQDELKNQQVDMHILDRLHPNNLLPYIYGEGSELYRPITQKDAPEWIIYEPYNQVAIGESNAFLSNVIEEKLTQFIEHFQYLFIKQSKSPIQINVINVNNDEEVVKGLINFIKKQLDKRGPADIVPIEVALYMERNIISSFERFSDLETVEEFEEVFGISLATKKLDASDVLRFIRENILYYRPLKHSEYGYAHISFYKMKSNDLPARNAMEEIESGTSLDGLLSSLSFLKTTNDYRRGFGLKGKKDNQNSLMQVSKYLNELASNLESGGTNPYRKNETIVTRTANYDEQILEKLYDSSYWVTFIEPNVDLNFFQTASRKLLVIHYSDQYSSSTQYDAITVTDKSSQYKLIIEQYLAGKELSINDKQIETAIHSFNSLNGEWLLRIIGSKGQFSREKLSIISAIKYIISTLDHEKILWIPISLEEILRIAGAVKLTKSEGVFSAKNLNVKGMHSDDLLLIGVETDNNEIFVHYYPVEVKIGYNQDSTIAKAKEQINKTHKLFSTQLSKVDEDGEFLFKNKFFRNFFVQLLIANAQKFISSKIWPEKNYEKVEELKESLLNDKYEFSNEINQWIGKGAVLSFKKEQTWRSVKLEEDILLVDLTEEDGYQGVMTEIQTLKENIINGKTDIRVENLLAYNYKTSKPSVNFEYSSNVKPQIIVAEKNESRIADNRSAVAVVEDISTEKKVATIDSVPEKNNNQIEDLTSVVNVPKDLKDIRVLLGTVEGSTKDVYWEYGHPELANRHILISGKSGQGKSYFIQCLLLELAQSGISNIIFDYTDGFKNSKLEPEFKEKLGDKLEQFFVVRDGFPINPFKRNQKELDENLYIDEDNTDIAERIKAVFSSIYRDLGIQQQNAIYEAVLNGLDKYQDEMNLERLIMELEEDGSGPAKTARSQIKPLIDKNPFNSKETYNWSELLGDKGKVFIVQLTGYNREVQMMITEFILWDMWNHQLNHGDKSRPLPVILDEAQNLDHREYSPSAKILTEGRKFGWSGWYATQSLRGQFSTDEISRLQNASQKIYFMPPENEISAIASNLSQDSTVRKEWEKKLSTLKKGQCVVYGPMLQPDGTLKQVQPVVINISSLNGRLN